jgi:regulatory protein
MGNRKITAIKVQKRNPNRVNIYLDGEFSFGLARIIAAWLNIGQELDEEKIATLREEDQQEVAYQQALNLIGFRLRTKSEVEAYLRENGSSEELIATIIERLSHSGLVDDRRFAQAWIENRSEFRPRSRRALAYELRRKGVSADVIEQSLEESSPDEELAYQAALKQSRRFRELEWPEFRRKLVDFLARRGFSYSTIAPVVDRVWAEQRSNQTPGDNSYDHDQEVIP